MDQTETPGPGEAPIMRPLGAGDPAPTFMLPDPDDVMISSAELLENGPLIVTFYRGIWCPYCRQDLKDLGNAAPDIRSCGASLVAIAHQTVPDSNGKFQREHGLEFPILDDRQGDVAVAYRIRWSPQELAAAEERLGKLPGLATETTWILPMQARYVIRRELVRRVIALDPVIDQTLGESSQLRYHSPVLQNAVDGLFTALASWRTMAVRL